MAVQAAEWQPLLLLAAAYAARWAAWGYVKGG
jgi:hypothetical protein